MGADAVPLYRKWGRNGGVAVPFFVSGVEVKGLFAWCETGCCMHH